MSERISDCGALLQAAAARSISSVGTDSPVRQFATIGARRANRLPIAHRAGLIRLKDQSTMFQVRPKQDSQWTIFDESDQPVFTGTWSECEEWLDLFESLQKAAARQSEVGNTSWFRRALAAVLPLPRKSPTIVPIEGPLVEPNCKGS